MSSQREAPLRCKANGRPPPRPCVVVEGPGIRWVGEAWNCYPHTTRTLALEYTCAAIRYRSFTPTAREGLVGYGRGDRVSITECNVSDRRFAGFIVSFDTGRDIFFSVRPGADWTSLNRIGRPFRTTRFIDSSGSSSGLRLWGGNMIFIDG